MERRWRESGELEDEVAWLAERVRQGSLSQRALTLAAHLGQPAAAVLVEKPQLPPGRRSPHTFVRRFVPWQSEIDRWGAALIDFGQEASLRAGLAACGRAHAAIETDSPDFAAEYSERLQLCARFLERQRQPSREALQPLQAPGGSNYWRERRLSAAYASLSHLLRPRLHSDPGSSLGAVLDLCARVFLPTPEDSLLEGVAGPAPPLPAESADIIRAAVADELLPWALSGSAQLSLHGYGVVDWRCLDPEPPAASP